MFLENKKENLIDTVEDTTPPPILSSFVMLSIVLSEAFAAFSKSGRKKGLNPLISEACRSICNNKKLFSK